MKRSLIEAEGKNSVNIYLNKSQCQNGSGIISIKDKDVSI